MKKQILSIFLAVLMVITVIPQYMIFSSADSFNFPDVSYKVGYCIPGDADGDGRVTAADARLVLRASVGLETKTEALIKVADMDKDGKLTAADARLILRKSVGLTGEDSDDPDYSKEILKKNQYNLNIFISNFTECNMANFTGVPSDESLVDFATRWIRFNNPSLIEMSDTYYYIYNGYECNTRIKEKNILDVIKKYFIETKNEGFFSGRVSQQCAKYENGYFIGAVTFTGAPFIRSGFAVIKNVETAGNTYYLDFDIYRLVSGMENLHPFNAYYGITAEEANSYLRNGVLKTEGSGTARITAGNINDRSTYKLTGYEVDYIYDFSY